MQWSYDDRTRRHANPIAVVNVRHASRQRNANRDLKCLVDSGSDVSGIPSGLLRRLDITYELTELVQDYYGNWQERQFSYVRVTLCGVEVGPIRVARLKDGRTGILGRDILNQFVVTLNGPELVCEIA